MNEVLEIAVVVVQVEAPDESWQSVPVETTGCDDLPKILGTRKKFWSKMKSELRSSFVLMK